ncbi:unnamed protein product [Lactuca virosa]|uniref:Uncharacterized protein n=1 Tax=Lactuca virosa TaxID=75947 RepID=A0AAU9M7I8_9ASTR|nr:unnamed protein product [Lactuca virosa]
MVTSKRTPRQKKKRRGSRSLRLPLGPEEKNAKDRRRQIQARSTRKPLRDVSNGGFKSSVRNPVIQKSTADTQQQDPFTICGDGASRDPLDRLLLVHSDLSVLIHQIDELVVQALEQKVRNKKEIESFAHLLNKMQTSLKVHIANIFSTLLTFPLCIILTFFIDFPNTAMDSKIPEISFNQ